ncbi:histidine triad nucleotide-binding protein [Petroclostridium sp. X23]|uniref:histidine triad nucleotide-binding protein n=1 Tax=Petroclostridium sp. X23 TaxID=3045146 RepID=UPI0024ADB680|nr:histidine triad nucleotide-binding protein [Petroclostridium sp. X23]WHH61599.1 histidine triad nucleotide-binding protein [Petroclostridium sp. X23]
MSDCIFCKIAAKEIPASVVYEDEKVLAFKDINPAAPVHVLVIPKQHFSSAMDIGEKDADIIAHIFKVCQKLAVDLGIADRGFRIVNNCGQDGGQTVGHIHFHLLGGRNLGWPPG